MRPKVTKPMEVLLLCDYSGSSAGTVHDHIDALVSSTGHRVSVLNSRGYLDPGLPLEAFDCVVVDWTIAAALDSFLPPDTRRRLRRFEGVKAGLVQDDYRWVNRTVSVYRYLGVDVLFGLAPPSVRDLVYSPERLRARTVTMLGGYVPRGLVDRPVPPFAQRPIDVAYRGRTVPAWLGELGQDKQRIGPRFAAHPSATSLILDISHREDDRIYGERWIEFLTAARAVLGTESGATVCDYTGAIQRSVETYIEQHPDAGFEEIRDRCFPDDDGKVPMRVISPRCFEAAALRTLMVLYEGEYSGILEPWRHYLPLRKDHSNQAEIVDTLGDVKACEEVVRRAYEEIACNPEYSFEALGVMVGTELERAAPARRPASRSPLTEARLRRIGELGEVRNRFALERLGRAAQFTAFLVWLAFHAVPRDKRPGAVDRVRAAITGSRRTVGRARRWATRTVYAALRWAKRTLQAIWRLAREALGWAKRTALAALRATARATTRTAVNLGRRTITAAMVPARALRRQVDALRTGIPVRIWAGLPLDAQAEYRHLMERLRASARWGSTTAVRTEASTRLVLLSVTDSDPGDVMDWGDMNGELAAGCFSSLEWRNDDDWGLGAPFAPGTVVSFPAISAVLQENPVAALALVRRALRSRRVRRP